MTKKFTKEIIVPKDKAEFYKEHADLTGKESAELGEHYDNVYCEEVTFEDGYKAVIEFVIADYDYPNWTEGSLFNTDDIEVSTCEGNDGNIFGEWFFWTDEPDTEYTVIVKESE